MVLYSQWCRGGGAWLPLRCPACTVHDIKPKDGTSEINPHFLFLTTTFFVVAPWQKEKPPERAAACPLYAHPAPEAAALQVRFHIQLRAAERRSHRAGGSSLRFPAEILSLLGELQKKSRSWGAQTAAAQISNQRDFSTPFLSLYVFLQDFSSESATEN